MISAALMVKNEEPFIGDALRSLFGVVDEIVIHDTGSEDRTIDIIEECRAEAPCPVRLMRHEWQHDFAHHRNAVQADCEGDWILVLDGDERIEKAGNLREAIQKTEKDSVAVMLHCTVGEGRYEEHHAVRAYRKSMGYWRYPIHNQLEGLKTVEGSDALIWSNYRGTLDAKAERSIPMLLKYRAGHPFDPHPPFFLAKTYRAIGDFGECERWSELCRELAGDDTRYAVNYVWLFQCYLVGDNGTYRRAERLIEEAIHRHPRFGELRHCRMSLDARRWLEAVNNPGLYVFQAQMSKVFTKALPEASKLLGFQLQYREPGGEG